MNAEQSARDEVARLASLARCAVMDTPREAAFDNIVFTVAQLFRAPMAMLTLVHESRVWAKASVGPIAREWLRTETFCDHLVARGELLVVEDASADRRFADMPTVSSAPGIRFFAGAPVFGPDRHVVGALCVLDRLSRTVQDRQRMQLMQLASEASNLLRGRIAMPNRSY